MKKSLLIYTLMCILTLSAACKKETIQAGDGAVSYINFFNASEVLSQNTLLSFHNWVIINKQQTKAVAEFTAKRQFPYTSSISPIVTTPDYLNLPAGSNYELVYWLPLYAGSNHIEFTADSAYVSLKDSTVMLRPESFSTQYLVESPENDKSYQLFSYEMDPTRKPGIVRVQLINLSPDFGTLEVFRSSEDGKQVGNLLTEGLAYGHSSPFVDIDTVGASKTRGNIILNFKKNGGKVVLTKAVPAISESVFSLVFQGFEKPAIRHIPTRNNTLRTISVASNLRTLLRRFY